MFKNRNTIARALSQAIHQKEKGWGREFTSYAYCQSLTRNWRRWKGTSPESSRANLKWFLFLSIKKLFAHIYLYTWVQAESDRCRFKKYFLQAWIIFIFLAFYRLSDSNAGILINMCTVTVRPDAKGEGVPTSPGRKWGGRSGKVGESRLFLFLLYTYMLAMASRTAAPNWLTFLKIRIVVLKIWNLFLKNYFFAVGVWSLLMSSFKQSRV